MSRSTDDFDLTKHMNAFSISSSDEKLSQQLDKTHLESTHSIFTVPSRPHPQPSQQYHVSQQQAFLQKQQQQSPRQQQQPEARWNQQQDAVTWNKGNTDPWDTHHDQLWDPSSSDPQQDEGWGQGPPGYTTISQGTYFGFNSILESPDIATMSKRDETTESSRQAFSKYKNKPVTFHPVNHQQP
ncbi:hypothetical protein INT47_003324 [Mucor saturninus]|uniref:Uncharacterized protein n=1 Tax=Mucor saturninus TaxID=64648 RepID=A0A8H7VDC7_9FUNG|nr:hypothetical protein INT47_003324 [Mucor saturninus]